jgi:hypothetical protein
VSRDVSVGLNSVVINSIVQEKRDGCSRVKGHLYCDKDLQLTRMDIGHNLDNIKLL